MIFIIAWRNIWRNKARSGVLIASIITGICAGIVLTGIMMGMYAQRQNDAIRNEVSNFQIHTPAFRSDNDPIYVIPNSENVMGTVSSNPEVQALSARVIVPGMILTAGSSAGIKVNGIDPASEVNARGLDEKLTSGSYLDTTRQTQILVGERLARKMQMKIKSRVVLTFEDTAHNVVSASFRVAGFYKTTNPSFDESVVYVNRDMLAELSQVGDDVHEIAVLLKDKRQSRKGNCGYSESVSRSAGGELAGNRTGGRPDDRYGSRHLKSCYRSYPVCPCIWYHQHDAHGHAGAHVRNRHDDRAWHE